MKILYRIYQIVVVLPLGLLVTLITALTTTIGCTLGSGSFWGYYPGKFWSMIIIRLALLPVKVEGREHLVKGQSYIFCSNHQGAFDIFLIYGFLGRNFKWMMKQSLRNIPFVGKACESAGFIFVDNGNRENIKKAYENARRILRNGMSMVIFPEGRRTFTGQMGPYRRGAFNIADELQLPVVPLTINGSFEVMPRTKDFHFITHHRLRLTIHEPIVPTEHGHEDLKQLLEQCRETTASALDPQYK